MTAVERIAAARQTQLADEKGDPKRLECSLMLAAG
jgi:hypothetical protein